MGQAIQTFRFTGEITFTYSDNELATAISDKMEILPQQGSVDSSLSNFWLQALLEMQLTHDPFAYYWGLRMFCHLHKNGQMPKSPLPPRKRTLRERIRQFLEP